MIPFMHDSRSRNSYGQIYVHHHMLYQAWKFLKIMLLFLHQSCPFKKLISPPIWGNSKFKLISFQCKTSSYLGNHVPHTFVNIYLEITSCNYTSVKIKSISKIYQQICKIYQTNMHPKHFFTNLTVSPHSETPPFNLRLNPKCVTLMSQVFPWQHWCEQTIYLAKRGKAR